jgi:cleavage and polyadenylation specificity factor subunit 2
MKSLNQGGSVLMPVDASARVLELLYLLDQLWAHHRLSFPIMFLAPESQKTVDHAKGMLEWLSEAATKQFSATRETPFDFKYAACFEIPKHFYRAMKVCRHWHELERFVGPKLVLSTMQSLESGMARDLFMAWAPQPENLILFTGRSVAGSLAHTLAQGSDGGHAEKTISLTINKKIPLEGDELKVHLRQESERKEREQAEAALLARKKRILEGEDDSDLDSEAADDLDQQLLFVGDRYDHYQRGNTTTGWSFFANESRTVMYPCVENRVRFDDYGEVIDPNDYIREEYQQLQQVITARFI